MCVCRPRNLPARHIVSMKIGYNSCWTIVPRTSLLPASFIARENIEQFNLYSLASENIFGGINLIMTLDLVPLYLIFSLSHASGIIYFFFSSSPEQSRPGVGVTLWCYHICNVSFIFFFSFFFEEYYFWGAWRKTNGRMHYVPLYGTLSPHFRAEQPNIIWMSVWIL